MRYGKLEKNYIPVDDAISIFVWHVDKIHKRIQNHFSVLNTPPKFTYDLKKL